jgi:bifunctional UDP-N-acetylglucosamine pyrophosphorylase / glucosamine-1-phosphate N-acetyltransferase
MNPPLNIVILAAGKGTRMKSDLPKVLHPLAGKPLIVACAGGRRSTGAASHLRDLRSRRRNPAANAIARTDLAWAKQEPQLGTGHAVQQAVPHLDPAALCLILYGDVPLTRPETLQEMT